MRGGGHGHGTCKDKLSEDACKAILDAGKCDKKGKQCKETCGLCDDDHAPGNGTCKDKLSEDACKAILDAGKCDKKPGKKCKETCDLCDDEDDHR